VTGTLGAGPISLRLRALESASVLGAVVGARGALPCRHVDGGGSSWLSAWPLVLAPTVPGGDTALPASREPLRAGEGRLGGSIRGSLRLLARHGGWGGGSVSGLCATRSGHRSRPQPCKPARSCQARRLSRAETLPTKRQRRAARRRWAGLIRRIYEVDPLVCSHCGGPNEDHRIHYGTQGHPCDSGLDAEKRRPGVPVRLAFPAPSRSPLRFLSSGAEMKIPILLRVLSGDGQAMTAAHPNLPRETASCILDGHDDDPVQRHAFRAV
jgi:hypothetical protein